MNRRVSFRILDIYIPDPLDVLLRLRNDEKLEGTVIDLSDDGTPEGKFAVVAVPEMSEPVIVPVKLVNEI